MDGFTFDNPPPFNTQAEQSVLGGLLIDNKKYFEVAAFLEAEDFYNKEHQFIFKTITEFATSSQPFDCIILNNYLQGQNIPALMGSWLAYLGILQNDTPSAANTVSYANIVKTDANRRRLIKLAGSLFDTAYKEKTNLGLFERVNGDVLKFLSLNKTGEADLEHIKPILGRTVDNLEIRFESEGEVTGLPTGFIDLDKRLNGLQNELIIIAGRPGMGKSTLAMNVMENVAIKTGKPVVFFSIEMSKELVALRHISSLGRIPLELLMSANLEDEHWARMTSAINIMADTNLYIDDSSRLTPAEISAKLLRLQREQGQIGLIVVDYLQLMTASKTGNRVAEITEITGCLRQLVKDFNCPVIALSQLNRDLERREDKRPVLSDLRESGSIEQDGATIIFVYRDEYYNKESQEKGVTELIVGKQRNGKTGTERVSTHLEFSQFENMEHRNYDY